MTTTGDEGPALDRLPIALEHISERASTIGRALLLGPALTLAALPLTLVAAHAVSEPATLAVLSDRPMLALQIAAGMLLWTVLFVRPLQRMLFALGKSRSVRVTADRVSVTERGRFRSKQWSEPMSSYRGVTRHVRSTLSGLRHEVVLVHRDRTRNVVLAVGATASEAAHKRVCALLALPEMAPEELYRKRRGVTAPVQPSLAGAGA
jgi:hypothetical protein